MSQQDLNPSPRVADSRQYAMLTDDLGSVFRPKSCAPNCAPSMGRPNAGIKYSRWEEIFRACCYAAIAHFIVIGVNIPVLQDGDYWMSFG